MGWSSGSRLFSQLVPIVEKYAPAPTRVDIYLDLIAAFVDEDWDTLDECKGLSKSLDEAIDEWWLD
jgi:hypothetical protein